MQGELVNYLKAALRVKADLGKLIEILKEDHMWKSRMFMHINNRNQIQPFELGIQSFEESLSTFQTADDILVLALFDPFYINEEALMSAKNILDQSENLKNGIIQWFKWSHDYQGLLPFVEGAGSSIN